MAGSEIGKKSPASSGVRRTNPWLREAAGTGRVCAKKRSVKNVRRPDPGAPRVELFLSLASGRRGRETGTERPENGTPPAGKLETLREKRRVYLKSKKARQGGWLRQHTRGGSALSLTRSLFLRLRRRPPGQTETPIPRRVGRGGGGGVTSLVDWCAVREPDALFGDRFKPPSQSALARPLASYRYLFCDFFQSS